MRQFAALPTSPSPAPRVKPAGLRLAPRRGPSLSPLKGGEGLFPANWAARQTAGAVPFIAGEAAEVDYVDYH
jgi:hypothetical protein